MYLTHKLFISAFCSQYKQIAIGPDKEGSRVYREQLVGLLGFGPERLVVDEEVRYPVVTAAASYRPNFQPYLLILFSVYSIYTTVSW